MRSRKTQRGFGLVELMISLVIGLLLLGGILEILLGNRESFQAQQRQAALQENSRLSSFLLSNTLSLAGFHIDGLKDENQVFKTADVIEATEGGNSDKPDSIRIRFQGQGEQHDCLGQAVGTASARAISDSEFFVDVDDKELQCRVYNPDGTVKNTQPLVNNVENMQIEYGLDTTGDGSVDRYLQANNVAYDQRQVRSIRVQLLLASPGDVLLQPTAQSYALLDTDGGPIKVTDRVQRQVLERVIALRNRLQ